MTLLFALAAGVIAAAGPVAFRTETSVRGDTVRLGDIADLSALPEALRARAIATPVARVREGSQSLSTRVMAARARAAIPGLSPWLTVEGDDLVHVTSVREATPPAPRVAVASIPVSAVLAGDVLTLHIEVGPVTVERPVRALQSGSAGRYVFVRTADGSVIRALVPEAS